MTENSNIAFDQIVQKYDKRLFNLLFRLTGDYDLAQDLAQEVFLIAYKEYSKFRGESDFFTWLYRIAVNHHRRHLRKQKVMSFFGLGERTPEEEVSDPGALEQMEKIEKLSQDKMIRQAVSELPVEFKETVVLYYFEDQACDDIAKILNCSPGTVKSRLWRGRQILAQKLNGLKAANNQGGRNELSAN
ncbi:MAG: sigma-70 family RNA polymerase sigma factor [bacterium]|nr:sigma-70 family RNA polymerase sigma factor [bacterium]